MAKKKVAKGIRTKQQPSQGDTETKKPAPQKQCPKCKRDQPTATRTCRCGYEFPKASPRKSDSKVEGMAATGDIGKRLEMGRQIIEMAGGLDKTTTLLKYIKQMGGIDAAQDSVTLVKEEAGKMKSFAEKWGL